MAEQITEANEVEVTYWDFVFEGDVHLPIRQGPETTLNGLNTNWFCFTKGAETISLCADKIIYSIKVVKKEAAASKLPQSVVDYVNKLDIDPTVKKVGPDEFSPFGM